MEQGQQDGKPPVRLVVCYMPKTNILNIVAFCALMENNGGILDKSPAYIMEKYVRYCESKDTDGWQFGLDKQNSQKVADWVYKWVIKR